MEPFSQLHIFLLVKREKPSCYGGSLPRVRKAIDALEIAEGYLVTLGISFRETLSLKLGKEYPHFYQITHTVRGELGKILDYCRVVDEALE